MGVGLLQKRLAFRCLAPSKHGRVFYGVYEVRTALNDNGDRQRGGARLNILHRATWCGGDTSRGDLVGRFSARYATGEQGWGEGE